ncbi:hypothetical protein [Vampirovibrio chlorellavorus]|uniref:hypothetical protein n=1 Tax=Vampirovibrio chlorellavorus TaxID=758823 RepID=UPI0026EA393B|nr:hypothetical protein [Vampirovibrio chlorellavorus]
MAFLGMHCPECNSKEDVHRKRRTVVRYAQVFDDKGIAIGEFRYYHLHCRRCESMFFVQERCLYDTQDMHSEKFIVPEEIFQKASLNKPGLAHIGTTASEYTLMIAAGADHPYALRRLAYNR